MSSVSKANRTGFLSKFSITVCICTSGRPAELRRCLDSLAAGTSLPRSAIVSDDSKDPAVAAEIRELCGQYNFVEYTEGPKRGLCANRNHVILQAKSSHVSLLDDDAVASAGFIELAEGLIREHPDKIITGDVFENGTHRSHPTNSTFLGHFGQEVSNQEGLENINLNCNVFPLAAFEIAGFDERIGFGYEDSDLCGQLLQAGFTIIYFSNLVNSHLPPGKGQYRTDTEAWQIERARFYTALRRHLRWRPNRLKFFIFALIAPFHLAIHAVRKGKISRAWCGWSWLLQDFRQLRTGAQAQNILQKTS